MKCPYCSYEESKVIDSRSADDGERIRRRRECLRCGKRFTTHEVIETVPIIVVKRDKSREVFDRNKLTGGILRACEKRPVSIEQIENMVNDIEAQLQSSLDREITSKQIGELAMDQLKNIDEVSYVRFASVYRQFKDINTFMDELNKLLTEKKQFLIKNNSDTVQPFSVVQYFFAVYRNSPLVQIVCNIKNILCPSVSIAIAFAILNRGVHRMPTSNSRIFKLRVLYVKQPMQLIKNYTKKSKMPLDLKSTSWCTIFL